MKRTQKYTGIILATLAFAVSMSVSDHAGSAEPDYSNEMHPVTFMPWADRKLAIRTLVRTADGQLTGKWLGYSKGGVRLTMMIDGNTFRQSIDPTTHEIDVPKLLSALSPQTGTDGGTYFTMRIMQPVTLEDGRVIQPGTDAQPSEVLLNVNDFYVTKTLQPTEASSQVPTPPAEQATAAWNDDLKYNGVTPATRPDDDGSENTILPDTHDDDEDNDAEPPMSPAMDVLGYGRPFSQAFLSSPVCNCVGGPCRLGDGFGKRGHVDRHGKCHNVPTRDGRHASCNHKGLDIRPGTPGAAGTSVMAAADGCLEIKNKTQHRRGDKISPSDLKRHGFGNVVYLTHGNGWETEYAHLASLDPKVRWGSCFKRGDVIGTMGATGSASSENLHFGVLKDGKYVDPKKELVGSSISFFSKTCQAPLPYADIDREMHDDLQSGQRSSARRSSQSQSVQ